MSTIERVQELAGGMVRLHRRIGADGVPLLFDEYLESEAHLWRRDPFEDFDAFERRLETEAGFMAIERERLVEVRPVGDPVTLADLAPAPIKQLVARPIDAWELFVGSAPAPVDVGVALLDLEAGQCRFPVGEADDGTTLFCAAPKASGGRSYCECHAQRVKLPKRAPGPRRNHRDDFSLFVTRGVRTSIAELRARMLG